MVKRDLTSQGASMTDIQAREFSALIERNADEPKLMPCYSAEITSGIAALMEESRREQEPSRKRELLTLESRARRLLSEWKGSEWN